VLSVSTYNTYVGHFNELIVFLVNAAISTNSGIETIILTDSLGKLFISSIAKNLLIPSAAYFKPKGISLTLLPAATNINKS